MHLFSNQCSGRTSKDHIVLLIQVLSLVQDLLYIFLLHFLIFSYFLIIYIFSDAHPYGGFLATVNLIIQCYNCLPAKVNNERVR